jgi:MFS family permease
MSDATETAAGDAPRALGRPATGPAAFGLMWMGHLLSLVGSGFTRFAFGVWVYRETGSVTQFALIALSAGLPGLLLSPLAGALVDRWDRRRVMLATDLSAAAASLAMALLIGSGGLLTWHVYLYAGIGSLLNAFQWPAYVAATTLLVPKRHLGRVSGLMQLGQAAAGTFAPMPAGFLLATVGLFGIIWIDLTGFVFAALTLVAVRVPRPAAAGAATAGRGGLAGEVAFGWSFIRQRPGLLGLLSYFALGNLVFSMALVLVTPLVLSFAPPAVLGTVLSVGNAGLLAGSLLMASWGGPRRRIHGILGLGLLQAVAIAGIGLKPSPTLIAGALFVALLALPIVNGCSQTIWQTKVPPGVQGRVFAVRRVIAQATAPVGQLAAGPLADHLAKPLLAPGGPLAAALGPLFGVGPGRGIGLLYAVLAVVLLAASAWGYARPRVRQVEEELADAVT